MKKTALAIQSFGRENEYRRAVLTILSYYAYTSRPVTATRVCLFTDRPEWFETYLSGLPVTYILLTPGKIKTMRGQIDFLHRMKIALIEETFTMADGGNMLYADSDTFFTADPTPLEQQLTADKSFMHLWEYPFSDMKDVPLPAGETFRAFYKLITSRQFTGADGRTIAVTPEMSSWNAGVMFFHPSHARFIPDVYALTDQFYPGTHNHASEQYAFSVMLQNNTQLQPCDSVIYHYWYRVKKQITDELLQKKFTGAWAATRLEDKLADIRKMTAMLPAYYNAHILTYRDNAIQAFNENKFGQGYKWFGRTMLRTPFSQKPFLKDVLYHTKRWIKGK